MGIGGEDDPMFTLQAGKQHGVGIAFGGNNTAGPIQVSTAINAHGGPHGRLDFESETFVLSGDFADYRPDQAAAVRAKGGDVGGGSEVLVCHGTMDPCSQTELAFSHKDHGADATKDATPTMRAMGHSGSHANAGGQLTVCITGDVTHTLRGEGHDGSEDGTGRGQPIVTAWSLMPMNSGKEYKARAVDVAQPLMAGGPVGGPVGGNQGGDFVTVDFTIPLRAFCAANANGAGIGRDGDPCLTLDCDGSAAVAFQASQSGMRLGDGTHPILDSNNGSRRHHGALIGSAVRRLTPGECESLQNFPRGYTAIPWKGKPAEDCPDGPRYKSLGNSMNSAVMNWIGRRIAMVEAEHNEAQDLFGDLPAQPAAPATPVSLLDI